MSPASAVQVQSWCKSATAQASGAVHPAALDTQHPRSRSAPPRSRCPCLRPIRLSDEIPQDVVAPLHSSTRSRRCVLRSHSCPPQHAMAPVADGLEARPRVYKQPSRGRSSPDFSSLDRSPLVSCLPPPVHLRLPPPPIPPPSGAPVPSLSCANHSAHPSSPSSSTSRLTMTSLRSSADRSTIPIPRFAAGASSARTSFPDVRARRRDGDRSVPSPAPGRYPAPPGFYGGPAACGGEQPRGENRGRCRMPHSACGVLLLCGAAGNAGACSGAADAAPSQQPLGEPNPTP